MRRVKQTMRYRSGTPIYISTMFLVLDHSFTDGPPVLWETMIFYGDNTTDGDTWRYTSREEALRNHRIILAAHRDEKRERDHREWERGRMRDLLARYRIRDHITTTGLRRHKPSKHTR